MDTRSTFGRSRFGRRRLFEVGAATVTGVALSRSSEASFRGDQDWPGNSTINWDHPQQVIANTTVVPLDALGRFWARARTSTHFLVDVIGYYP